MTEDWDKCSILENFQTIQGFDAETRNYCWAVKERAEAANISRGNNLRTKNKYLQTRNKARQPKTHSAREVCGPKK
jgi:hypothetical protein